MTSVNSRIHRSVLDYNSLIGISLLILPQVRVKNPSGYKQKNWSKHQHSLKNYYQNNERGKYFQMSWKKVQDSFSCFSNETSMNVREKSKELCEHSPTPRVSVFSNIHSCSISIDNDNFSGAPAARRAAKRSPILITGKQRKPVSGFSHGYHG